MGNNSNADPGAGFILLAVLGGCAFLIYQFFSITWAPIRKEYYYIVNLINYNNAKGRFEESLQKNQQYKSLLARHEELLKIEDFEVATLSESEYGSPSRDPRIGLYCGINGHKIEVNGRGMLYKKSLYTNDYGAKNSIVNLIVCENGKIYRLHGDPIYNKVFNSRNNKDYNLMLVMEYGKDGYIFKKYF